MSNRHWIQSYDSIPAEIDADRYPCVNALMESAMRQFAAKPAFRAFGRSLTYADVDRLSSAFAAYLQKEVGVRKGDRVAVMLPNVVSFPIAFIAIAKIGGVQVNVNPLYTARELEHQLNDAGVEVIVAYNGSTSALARVIDKTRVRTVITAGPGDGCGAGIAAPAVDESLPGATTLSEAIEQGAKLELEPVAVSGDDLLFLQYTGGTTGLSKGAALSHRNLVANIEQFKAFMPDTLSPGNEVIVTAIPLYHIFALTVNFLTYFSVGAENWLVANPRDIESFIDVLKAARPTIFVGVNTLYAALASHPRVTEVDWSRLKLSAGGGAAMIDIVSERWKSATRSFIREGYGLSETSPVVSFNPQFISRFTGDTGLPVPSTDVKLLDENDREAGIGEPGEICVKGPQVMGGYWQKPEANARAFTADGYFRTGDVGVFDDKGFLKIVDRKKDMVIVSGFNVYPNEVEAVATAFAGVAECACIGVPDEKTGEAVKLFVIKAQGADVSAEALIAHCRAAMAAYKVPKIVHFVDALPKSAVGKILRRELRQIN
ncbi:Long-chain-fatty-acid--CoA ligase [Paraburkholderia piptadeniae]|uniref:Long-chain-fatty-acid--CoA ligase n=1 Tax=Paraburkholderia piptadeniae TaxID=1701573 RepID=A0A1N7SIV1_9BURK|nr:AMP-binding protein [Paraburkholderia piptadeniae]SIT47276.1 Long-chain-fatty-acid--CoA ligase [Paraburkholderia piptadeniae]